jgi:glutamate synthase (NADPH) small chain
MNLNEAKEKAARCLECKEPKCVEGCPIHVNIPGFIKFVKEGNLEEAYKVILEKNYFGSICGRVCSHDIQCKGSCVQAEKGEPVDIGELEAFVSDWGLINSTMGKRDKSVLNKERVAVVGAGPAGLTCALRLERMGYAVTLFEKTSELGGILQYGIPERRLPKDIVFDTVDAMTLARMEVEVGKTLGKDFTINELFKKGYKAIFLGIGCDMPRKLNIPGIEKKGVHYAKEFLKKIDHMKFENVIVIGGGNVAMDVARTVKERGAKTVNVLYRKSRVEMKANQIEIVKAIESGINIVTNSVVTEILGTDVASGVKCANGSTYRGETIVVAIGSIPDFTVLDDLKLTDRDLVSIDEYGETSKEFVFAGGDLTELHPNVSRAVNSAIRAADGIDRKMKIEKEKLQKLVEEN